MTYHSRCIAHIERLEKKAAGLAKLRKSKNKKMGEMMGALAAYRDGKGEEYEAPFCQAWRLKRARKVVAGMVGEWCRGPRETRIDGIDVCENCAQGFYMWAP